MLKQKPASRPKAAALGARVKSGQVHVQARNISASSKTRWRSRVSLCASCSLHPHRI